MAPAQSSPFMEEDDDNEEVERVELETTSSYHPSAPSSEIFDMRTTVDPSYIISLIRKLLPHSVKNAYSSHGDNDCNASVGELETGIRGTVQTSSPGVLSITNRTDEAMDTHDETSELAHQKEGIEDSFGPIKDNNISTVDEAAWEECGCILWDLSVNKTHAVFMVENLLLEVLLSSLAISQSLRVTEIGLGILANIACHEVLRNRMISMPGLIDTIVDQLFLDDSLCLCEAFRLLSLGLQDGDSVTWVNTLQPEHILRRILWVVENTLNPQLLEKGINLLLAIIESQQEVAQTLLQSLMKLGLPSLLVSLLACEMKHLFGERVPDSSMNLMKSGSAAESASLLYAIEVIFVLLLMLDI
ncbi:Arm repeat superfamily protein [Thalictrum thalictroides]|uniref:Arm repeat superfamily protein n=1 Tax=Thalictrum thalictroides TaxID=46969 RepID=A0A7J6VLQ7_THATH|nr:Arm repeat superfamily protein [Thalictrum thalictroides]